MCVQCVVCMYVFLDVIQLKIFFLKICNFFSLYYSFLYNEYKCINIIKIYITIKQTLIFIYDIYIILEL